MTDVRGRQTRREEETVQRRRRSDTTIDGGQRLKLAIPPDVEARLQEEGRTPRWVNDEGNRMHNATVLDDYDKVEGVEPRVVGTTKEGKPIHAHLCSKPTSFIREDQEKLDQRRQETERALLRGKAEGDPISGNDSFYADAANNLTRGGRGSP